MARFGRDPAFSRYIDGGIAPHPLCRTENALVSLDPAANAYLQCILCGTYQTALPRTLHPENQDVIRSRIDLRSASARDLHRR